MTWPRDPQTESLEKEKNFPLAVQLELKDLSGRDRQLWSIAALVLTIVSLGFASLLLPRIMSKTISISVDTEFLPQLVSGFIALVLLLNIYLLAQKRRLDRLREIFIRQALFKNGIPQVDSLTNTFTREYLAVLLDKEASRAAADQSSIAIGIVESRNLTRIDQHFGKLGTEHLLLVLSQIMKANFRGYDVICRYEGSQFVIVMPYTTAAQAQHAFDRLLDMVHSWNSTTQFDYKLDLEHAVAECKPGADIHAVLESVRTRLRAQLKTRPLGSLPLSGAALSRVASAAV